MGILIYSKLIGLFPLSQLLKFGMAGVHQSDSEIERVRTLFALYHLLVVRPCHWSIKSANMTHSIISLSDIKGTTV